MARDTMFVLLAVPFFYVLMSLGLLFTAGFHGCNWREASWMGFAWFRLLIHPARYGEEMWLFSQTGTPRERKAARIEERLGYVPVAWQWRPKPSCRASGNKVK